MHPLNSCGRPDSRKCGSSDGWGREGCITRAVFGQGGAEPRVARPLLCVAGTNPASTAHLLQTSKWRADVSRHHPADPCSAKPPRIRGTRKIASPWTFFLCASGGYGPYRRPPRDTPRGKVRKPEPQRQTGGKPAFGLALCKAANAGNGRRK